MTTSLATKIETFPAKSKLTAQGKSKYAPEYREKIVQQLLDENLDVSLTELADIHNLNEGTLASWRTQYKRKYKQDEKEVLGAEMNVVIQGLREEIRNSDKLIKAIDKDVEEAQRIISEADDKKQEILDRKEELVNLLKTSKKLKK